MNQNQEHELQELEKALLDGIESNLQDRTGLLVMYKARGLEGEALAEVFPTTPEAAQTALSEAAEPNAISFWVSVPSPTAPEKYSGMFKVDEDLCLVRVIGKDS